MATRREIQPGARVRWECPQGVLEGVVLEKGVRNIVRVEVMVDGTPRTFSPRRSRLVVVAPPPAGG